MQYAQQRNTIIISAPSIVIIIAVIMLALYANILAAFLITTINKLRSL
jgi:hypothetical protein